MGLSDMPQVISDVAAVQSSVNADTGGGANGGEVGVRGRPTTSIAWSFNIACSGSPSILQHTTFNERL